MRWYVAVTLRSLISLIAVTAGAVIGLLGLFGTLTALGGTGGFTAAPPPAHPRIVAAIIFAAIGVALLGGVFALARFLLKTVDKAEER